MQDSAQSTEARWVCEKPFGSTKCNAVTSIRHHKCHRCRSLRPYHPKLFSEAKVKIGSEVTEELEKATADINIHGQRPESSEDDPVSAQMPASEDSSDVPSQMPSDPGGAVGGADGTSVQRPVSTYEKGAEKMDDEVLEFKDQECRLVLVGKTGNGKSHSGNTILGLRAFKPGFNLTSTTVRCQRHSSVRFGIRLEVVDTPGLFDTELSQEDIQTEMVKCLGILAPGPHAIVVVLRLDVKFTAEETKAVEKLDDIFGVQLIRFLVVVFSHGDILEKEGVTLEDMLKEAPSELKKLLRRVNNRYVVFDNTTSEAVKQQQVKKLVQTIGRMMKVNGGGPYTNALLEIAERCVQDREIELREGRDGPRGGSGRHDSTLEKIQVRNMVRKEVECEGSPLLEQIKARIEPLLRPIFQTLGSMVMTYIFKIVEKKISGALM